MKERTIADIPLYAKLFLTIHSMMTARYTSNQSLKGIMPIYIYIYIDALEKIFEILDKFVSESDISQFPHRLSFLYILNESAKREEKVNKGIILKRIEHITKYLIIYYSEFLEEQQKVYRSTISPIEDKVTELSKIVRWDISNYYAFKQSMDRVHRQLNSIYKEFLEATQIKFRAVVIDKLRETYFDEGGLFVYLNTATPLGPPDTKIKPRNRSKGDMPYWVQGTINIGLDLTNTISLQNILLTIRNIKEKDLWACREGENNEWEEMFKEIIEGTKELKERSKHIKRRALTDFFKTLNSLGFTHTYKQIYASLDLPYQPYITHHTFLNILNTSGSKGLVDKSTMKKLIKYMFGSIDLLNVLMNMPAIHSDLDINTFEFIKGYSVNLVNILLLFNASLFKLSKIIQKFSAFTIIGCDTLHHAPDNSEEISIINNQTGINSLICQYNNILDEVSFLLSQVLEVYHKLPKISQHSDSLFADRNSTTNYGCLNDCFEQVKLLQTKKFNDYSLITNIMSKDFLNNLMSLGEIMEFIKTHTKLRNISGVGGFEQSLNRYIEGINHIKDQYLAQYNYEIEGEVDEGKIFLLRKQFEIVCKQSMLFFQGLLGKKQCEDGASILQTKLKHIEIKTGKEIDELITEISVRIYIYIYRICGRNAESRV